MGIAKLATVTFWETNFHIFAEMVCDLYTLGYLYDVIDVLIKKVKQTASSNFKLAELQSEHTKPEENGVKACCGSYSI